MVLVGTPRSAAATGPKHVRAAISYRRDIGNELWVVRVRPEVPIPFVPGQYATLAVRDGDRMIERPYSMVSAPHEEELEFFLERVDSGALTPQLYDVPEGGEVWIRPRAKGLFLRGLSGFDAPRMLVATVTGIAPFLSFIRHMGMLAAKGEDSVEDAQPLLVLHGASNSLDLVYQEEMEHWAATLPNLAYVPTVSRPWAEPSWTGEVGRVEDIARKYLDQAGLEHAAVEIFLCGNPQMVDKMRQLMVRAMVPDSHVKEEQYWRED